MRDVIYFIETYDVTTVRASTPMYLLARVIKSMGIKMVLSGILLGNGRDDGRVEATTEQNTVRNIGH